LGPNDGEDKRCHEGGKEDLGDAILLCRLYQMQGKCDAGEHTENVVVNVLIRTTGMITTKEGKRR